MIQGHDDDHCLFEYLVIITIILLSIKYLSERE